MTIAPPEPVRSVEAPAVRRRMARSSLVVAGLAATCAGAALFALGTGTYALAPSEVVQAMLHPDAGFARTAVVEWRLPRVTVALAFGAALGLSGAIFQTLTRNPLGSPDVIGFSTGSYTGARVALTVLGAGQVPTAAGALAGGLLSAVLVYALAWRRGVGGFRLIIVGIAVTAMLSAVNTWLLLRADLEVAMAAAIWGAGSISLIDWAQGVPVLLFLAACVPAVVVLRAPLRQLELGDDAARAHGVRVEPARLSLLVTGVALVAAATALAGPIPFVALAAPQIAHRMTRLPGLPLTASALTGALLLLLADIAAQHALPVALPVGVVTVVVGGGYLIWLLVMEASRRT